MHAPQNDQGQILIPALAAYFGLLALFLSIFILAVHLITQQRMDMAAQAAALSAARAQAEMLNEFAGYNNQLNMFLERINNDAAMEEIERPIFTVEWIREMARYDWGFRTYPPSVGRVVVQLNGGDPKANYEPRPMRAYLYPQSLELDTFAGAVPDGSELLPNVYYTRKWEKSEENNVQPPHKTIWTAAHENVKARAAARVYLDSVSPDQNGGFLRPYIYQDDPTEEIGIQSRCPQFNARLIPVSVALEALSRLSIAEDLP